ASWRMYSIVLGRWNRNEHPRRLHKSTRAIVPTGRAQPASTTVFTALRNGHDSANLTRLVQKRFARDAVKRRDRETGGTETGRHPGVAGVEQTIPALRTIPIVSQRDGVAVGAEGVGLPDMPAQALEAALGKFDLDDCVAWIIEILG